MGKDRNVPELRFPGFGGGWERKKLGDLLEFKNGINASKEQYGSGVKFVNVLDILNNDFITYDKIIGRVNVDQDTIQKFTVGYGDILFQRSSETREEVGTATVYLDKAHVATFGGFVIRGKMIGEYAPIFLNKLLKTDSARDSITSKSGGSTRYNVGQEILSTVELLFPTLPEQTKIADFLSAVDEKLQALKKKRSALESYKKGVMQQLFSQAVRFRDTDGKAFGDWEEKRLGDVFSFKVTNSFSRENLNYLNGQVKNIHYGDIHTKFPTLFDINKELVPFINSEIPIVKIPDDNYCKVGDLIFADASEDLADVGKSIEIVNLNGEKVLSGLHTILARPQSNLFSVGFLGYLFRSEVVRLQIQKSSQGSKVLSISAGRLSNISISFPSLPEQAKIADLLRSLDQKIQATQQHIARLEIWKKGLLQKLFV